MSTTSIEWTERVWNPTTGCDKISTGCRFCYAETIAERFWKTQYPPVEAGPTLTQAQYDEWVRAHGTEVADDVNRVTRPRRFTDVQTHEDRLLEPLKWRKPARVFVNSMSDLFHEDVPDWFIDRVFAVMALAPRHTFQILTKRPERMREYVASRSALIETCDFKIFFASSLAHAAREVSRLAGHPAWMNAPFEFLDNAPVQEHCTPTAGWPLPNVWLGVSVENQQYADARREHLEAVAALGWFTWVSGEPLLAATDFSAYLQFIRWLVVGGESGAGARPMDLAWARSIVQQCQSAGVPVFYKQGGTAHRCEHSSKGGCLDCAPADLRVREYPRLSPEGDTV